MSKRTLIVLVCLSIGACLYLLKRNYVLKQRLQKSLTTIRYLDESAGIYGTRFRELTEMTHIDLSTFARVSVTAADGKVLDLRSLTAGGPKLIYRFPRHDSTLVQQFERLKVLGEHIDDSNVVLLLSLPRDSDVDALYNKFQRKFLVVNVNPSDLEKFHPERYHVPYCFVLDQELQARFLFLPDKRMPDAGGSYFKRITDLFDSYHLLGL